MSDHDHRDERLMTSLRAYGAVLDRAAEEGSKDATVAELVTLPPRRRLARPLLAAAACVAVVAAGVGLLATRDRDTGPSVHTGPSASVSVPPSPTTTSAPKPAAGPFSNIVVATTNGVLRFDAAGKEHRVVEGPVAAAVSDTNGGVVFQRAEGDATLLHLPAGAAEPVAVVSATGGEWLKLWDVAVMNGDAVVVYSRHSAPSPQDNLTTDTPSEHLEVTSLATGATRSVVKVGGWEWGPGAISAGGDRYALVASAEVTYRFEFRNPNGTVLRVPGNPFDDAIRFPDGNCQDDPSCPAGVAIAADGKRYAYIEPLGGQAEDYFSGRDFRIVVVDSTTGETVDPVEVHFPERGQDRAWVHSLDLTDAGTVIVNWAYAGDTLTPQKPLIADVESGQVSTLPVVGTARAG